MNVRFPYWRDDVIPSRLPIPRVCSYTLVVHKVKWTSSWSCYFVVYTTMGVNWLRDHKEHWTLKRSSNVNVNSLKDTRQPLPERCCRGAAGELFTAWVRATLGHFLDTWIHSWPPHVASCIILHLATPGWSWCNSDISLFLLHLSGMTTRKPPYSLTS